MKIYLPDGLKEFASNFSKFKTPAKRSQGFMEQPGQLRGQGDMIDTIGSLMLWKYLVESGIPSVYLLTALQGDDGDIITGRNPQQSINVKTSFWDPGDMVCDRCHLAIKKAELNKLADIYCQVMVHLDPVNDKPHVHLCGWVSTHSELFINQEETIIPNTGGERGFWINNKNFQSISNLILWLRV